MSMVVVRSCVAMVEGELSVALHWLAYDSLVPRWFWTAGRSGAFVFGSDRLAQSVARGLDGNAKGLVASKGLNAEVSVMAVRRVVRRSRGGVPRRGGVSRGRVSPGECFAQMEERGLA